MLGQRRILNHDLYKKNNHVYSIQDNFLPLFQFLIKLFNRISLDIYLLLQSLPSYDWRLFFMHGISICCFYGIEWRIAKKFVRSKGIASEKSPWEKLKALITEKERGREREKPGYLFFKISQRYSASLLCNFTCKISSTYFWEFREFLKRS